MSSCSFRLAVRDDTEQLAQLYSQLAGDDAPSQPDVVAQIWDLQQQYPDYRIYVGESGGAVIATSSLIIIDNPAHGGCPFGIIENVVVDRAARGRNVGRALMRHLLRSAAHSGCYKVSLSAALHRERAHAFYQRLGFELHGYSFLIRPEVAA